MKVNENLNLFELCECCGYKTVLFSSFSSDFDDILSLWNWASTGIPLGSFLRKLLMRNLKSRALFLLIELGRCILPLTVIHSVAKLISLLKRFQTEAVITFLLNDDGKVYLLERQNIAKCVLKSAFFTLCKKIINDFIIRLEYSMNIFLIVLLITFFSIFSSWDNEYSLKIFLYYYI